ncbi:signal peptidase II [Sedimentibacter sp. MB31-C6]|uniref:signal peptidase II n=1 Tax=Sedimentibacter sp. MB31-C6 TaxID=3109366 RepID=UPI002DDD781B|nr:signal peptidase II [Sedimentibacter sp. MB36-C1]WSI04338.1 signal peptidase II [Sedimentibacter sp. MB36-C1]
MNIFFGVVFIFSIFIDQITKLWAVNVLKDGSSIKIIGDFLMLSYVENRGAAFGILQNQLWFFVIATIVMMSILLYIFIKFKNITMLSRLSITLIGGGAIGNFVDRIKLGYVVDFIDVRFGNIYNFPVFNFADSFVVVGSFLMVILILFNKFEKSGLNE